MRHRVYGKHLGRDKNQRTALFRSLVGNLILREPIETTQAKAKAIKGLVDTLIVKSKQDSPAAKSVVTSYLVQPILIKKIVEEIAPRYTDRNSGFTTMVKLGTRLGDGSMMVRMSLVDSKVTSDKAKATSSETTGEGETVVEEKPKKTRVRKGDQS